MRFIESLLRDYFKGTIIWEQNGPNLAGRYAYVKQENDEVGIFIGYALDSDSSITRCITLVFPHSTSLMEPDSKLNAMRRSFYRILIRANLKLTENHYKMISGKKLPAIIRTKSLRSEKADFKTETNRFFRESVTAIEWSQPVYRVVA